EYTYIGQGCKGHRARDRPVPYTAVMPSTTDPRRLVILTEGQFGLHHAKTAIGVIRYRADDVVAVLDSSQAGRNVSDFLPGFDIPVVAPLDDALALPGRPNGLLIGIAPAGGRLPTAWRRIILDSIAA